MLRGHAERLRKTENGLPLGTTGAIQYHRHRWLTNPHGVRKLSLRQALGFHQLAEPLGKAKGTSIFLPGPPRPRKASLFEMDGYGTIHWGRFGFDGEGASSGEGSSA